MQPGCAVRLHSVCAQEIVLASLQQGFSRGMPDLKCQSAIIMSVTWLKTHKEVSLAGQPTRMYQITHPTMPTKHLD